MKKNRKSHEGFLEARFLAGPSYLTKVFSATRFFRNFAYLAVAFLLAASAIFAFPGAAFAEYENRSVTGTMQINTDASFDVTERRSYYFSEPYSAIVWSIPSLNAESTVDVSTVRSFGINKKGETTGKWRAFKDVSFNPSWRELLEKTGGVTEAMNAYFETADEDDATDYITKPSKRTYSLDSSNDKIYIFPRSANGNAAYECKYTVGNAIKVYDDVAELYWTYSLPQGDEFSQDISFKIKLPVPKGDEAKPYENVYAWGHGPEGSVDVRNDGVIEINVPLVRSGQYSSVHVVFPRNWLHNIDRGSDSIKGGTRLGYALSEEENWVDTASSHKINSYLIAIVVLSLCLLALIAVAIMYGLFGREKKPSSGAFSLDIDEDRAVCGRLLRWDRHSAYDLSYELLHLIELGAVQVLPSDDPGAIRFKLSPESKSVNLNEVQRGVLFLLFETIGEGYESISIDDVRAFCSKNPSRAVDAMKAWQSVLTDEVSRAGVFDKRSLKASRIVLGISAFMILVAIALLVFGGMFWTFAVSFVTALICAAVAYIMPRRSQKGIELAERLDKAGFKKKNEDVPWEEPLAKAFGDALTA